MERRDEYRPVRGRSLSDSEGNGNRLERRRAGRAVGVEVADSAARRRDQEHRGRSRPVRPGVDAEAPRPAWVEDGRMIGEDAAEKGEESVDVATAAERLAGSREVLVG